MQTAPCRYCGCLFVSIPGEETVCPQCVLHLIDGQTPSVDRRPAAASPRIPSDSLLTRPAPTDEAGFLDWCRDTLADVQERVSKGTPAVAPLRSFGVLAEQLTKYAVQLNPKLCDLLPAWDRDATAAALVCGLQRVIGTAGKPTEDRPGGSLVVPVTEDEDGRADSSSDSAEGIPPEALPEHDGAPTGAAEAPAYTLGDLIRELESSDIAHAHIKATADRQATKSPIAATWWYVQAGASRWQPDPKRMPGIERIELICNRLYGSSITAESVRRLRARLCDEHHMQLPRVADQLDLITVANIIDGVREVSLDGAHKLLQDHTYHGLANLDQVSIGGGESVQITGLSCKVIAGTTPTACPDANPAVPPSVLPAIDRAIRRLNKLPPGTAIHWVGHDTGYRSRCQCHPEAPCAAPFDAHRWGQFAPAAGAGESVSADSSSGADGAVETTPPVTHAVGTAPPADWPTFLSAADLARRTRLNSTRLESALRRFREKNPDCCNEQQNPRRNEPRYLYRVADVWPVVQKLLTDRG
jgi:hypothetical protein